MFLISSLLISLMASWANAAANDGYRICRDTNPGCTAGGTIVAINSGTEVNEWCTCKLITNTNATNDIFIPTKTEAEYDAFLTNPPSGINVAACTTNGGVGTYLVSGAVASFSVRGCDRVSGTVNGGGGGGGTSTSTNFSPGGGGTGGRVTLTNSVLTTTSTSTVTIVIGNGGTGGECQSGALGGTGGYDGGIGSLRNTTNGTAQDGQAGGGTSANGGVPGTDASDADHGAGDGEYGGGGGGGDRNANTRNGGGGGGATVVTLDASEIVIAGGGGGGGGCRCHAAGGPGGSGGNACNGSVNGQDGTSDGGINTAGPGAGGGACLSTLSGSAYAASGGTGGAGDDDCALATGANGSVSLTFSRTTSLP